jgi:hypothetical protein
MNSQESLQNLTAQLTRWDMRRRTADMLIWVPRGMLAGLLIAVLVAAAARFRPLLTNQELTYIIGGIVVLSLLISLVALLLQQRTTVEKARFADKQFGLQERTTTAIEIQSGRLETLPVLAEQQLNDTMRAVEHVNPKSSLPLRVDWHDLAVLLLAIALLAAAVILPNPQVDTLLQQRAIDKAIAEQIEALEALGQEIRENPDLTEEQQKELLEPIESAVEALQEGDISQEEAVAVLSETEADLRDLGAENINEALQEALQNAGQPLAENETSQTLGEALQNGRENTMCPLAERTAPEPSHTGHGPGLTRVRPTPEHVRHVSRRVTVTDCVTPASDSSNDNCSVWCKSAPRSCLGRCAARSIKTSAKRSPNVTAWSPRVEKSNPSNPLCRRWELGSEESPES